MLRANRLRTGRLPITKLRSGGLFANDLRTDRLRGARFRTRGLSDGRLGGIRLYANGLRGDRLRASGFRASGFEFFLRSVLRKRAVTAGRIVGCLSDVL